VTLSESETPVSDNDKRSGIGAINPDCWANISDEIEVIVSITIGKTVDAGEVFPAGSEIRDVIAHSPSAS
jgi:hypothetical protein